MNKVINGIEKSYCDCCGAEMQEGEDCRYIADTGEIYCYEDINTIEDIENTCIGKDLLQCGYSKEYIWFLFDEDSEYSKTLTEEGTTEGMTDEDGDAYIEVFYTTV